MGKTILYRPTGEQVTVVGIANEGQERPGDPGAGVRLYAVRLVHPKGGRFDTFQAAAHELAVSESGRARAFNEHLDAHLAGTVTATMSRETWRTIVSVLEFAVEAEPATIGPVLEEVRKW
jgi:hypothetical protein